MFELSEFTTHQTDRTQKQNARREQRRRCRYKYPVEFQTQPIPNMHLKKYLFKKGFGDTCPEVKLVYNFMTINDSLEEKVLL